MLGRCIRVLNNLLECCRWNGALSEDKVLNGLVFAQSYFEDYFLSPSTGPTEWLSRGVWLCWLEPCWWEPEGPGADCSLSCLLCCHALSGSGPQLCLCCTGVLPGSFSNFFLLKQKTNKQKNTQNNTTVLNFFCSQSTRLYLYFIALLKGSFITNVPWEWMPSGFRLAYFCFSGISSSLSRASCACLVKTQHHTATSCAG